MSVLDHISLVVSDYARAKAFYKQALAPLGIELIMEYGDAACGFGRDGKPELWFGSGLASYQRADQVKVINPTHVAFAARSRAEVDAFHEAALAAGGKDFGAPGLRSEYHPNYYGAFVLDPDGHNIEAVYHRPV
jgi:catechol 2,3-dioxygenase-like lactoylglutathione lyase family enzyme